MFDRDFLLALATVLIQRLHLSDQNPGQLGLETSRLAEARSDIVLRSVTAEEADFRHPEQVAAVVRTASNIDAVVNTVAYIAVDKA